MKFILLFLEGVYYMFEIIMSLIQYYNSLAYIVYFFHYYRWKTDNTRLYILTVYRTINTHSCIEELQEVQG